MSTKSPKARPSTLEMLDAIEHNSKIFKDSQVSHRYCVNDCYFLGGTPEEFWLIKPGETGPSASAGKGYDAMAGCFCKVLPFYTTSGADGLRVLQDGSTQKIELKMVHKEPSRFGVGPNGGIIGGDSSKKPNVRQDCKAGFEIVNNLESKKVETILVVQDNETWEIVEAKILSAELTYDHLKFNQDTGELKTGKKRTIPLSYFISHGTDYRPDGVTVVGIEAWEDRIYAKAGVTRSEASKCMTWTDDLCFKLEMLSLEGYTHQEIASQMDCTKQAVNKKLQRLRKARDTIPVSNDILIADVRTHRVDLIRSSNVHRT